MTERKPPGTSFETWVDAQIARARDAGAFDDLPGAGKPLPRRTGEETAYQWAVDWARRENVDVLGMLPPGLALRREREDLPRRVAGLPSEAAVRALAEDYDERVRAFRRRPQESRWSPVPGLADVEALVAGWRAIPRDPAPPPVPAPVPRRRRWWAGRRRAG